MNPRFAKLLVGLSLFFATGLLDGADLKILSHNVWYGFTKDAPGNPAPQRHRDFQKWVRAQAPDIVALQELNGYTEEKLKADAASWGHAYSALLKTGGFPTGITSNAPITGVVRTLEGFHHGLLRAETHGHTVYVVHLHPSNWQTRHQEVGALVRGLDGLAPEVRANAIVLGDFNTFSPLDKDAYLASDLEGFFARRDRSMGEKNLRDGQLDFEAIGTLEAAGWKDVVALNHETGQQPPGTFPTQLRAHEEHGDDRRLDYVFVAPALAEKCVWAKVIDDETTQMLSDHLPVVAVFGARDAE